MCAAASRHPALGMASDRPTPFASIAAISSFLSLTTSKTRESPTWACALTITARPGAYGFFLSQAL